MFAQLPQSELEGLDPSCRRFRLENGDSMAEKDEVRTYDLRVKIFISGTHQGPDRTKNTIRSPTKLIEYFMPHTT